MEETFQINKQHKFTKLRVRMLRWANDNSKSPKKGCHTKRYETIEVTTAQKEGSLLFSGVKINGQDDHQLRTLEAVCVQHEIDHLNGMRILDRVYSTTYVRDFEKIGRNKLVTIKKGDVVKILKYKKTKKFLDQGWTIQVGDK
jgi:NhaP-type Na+/H+ and K+/H+ antiporter